MRLVLASASPARRRALEDAGVRPIVQVSGVDEEALAEQLEPMAVADLALELARAKARDVAAHFADQHDAIVVGCDSIFELDGAPHGKPLRPEVAVERIRAMSGRTGVLHTGHWVCHAGTELGETTATAVTFADLDDDEIRAYVDTGEPLNVAGSFTIDGRGGPFVARIDGDPSNVVGISLPTLRLMLRRIGVNWPGLWATP